MGRQVGWRARGKAGAGRGVWPYNRTGQGSGSRVYHEVGSKKG